MAGSVSGLVSGLDTNTIISQLMQVEASGQTRLKTKVTSEQKAVTAYQSVNTKLAALKTAADDMGKLATWRAAKATSTSATVTATSTSTNSTATGSVTFDVTSLARAQVSTTRGASTGDVTSSGSISLTKGDGTVADIDITADRSLSGIASAINAADLGIKATVVELNDGTGQSVLQMSSAKTGAANGFTVDGGFDTAVMTPTAASDAKLQVGGPEELGGYSVSSATNSFTGLIAGTSITVTKEGETGVTVDATSDTSAITAKMKALVDAANAALGQISSNTKYDAANKTKAPLTGDFAVRQIAQKMLSTVGGGIEDFGSAGKLGISLTRDGTLAFDPLKFEAAYIADPSTIKAASSTFGASLSTVSELSQTNVTNMVNGRNSLIKTMTSQIDNWDIRLATRKSTLTRQFAGLETSLSSLKNKSSWLSSQIAAL